MNDDTNLIKERIQSLEESVVYFGVKNKEKRERWVARAFIRNLNIPFEDTEAQSPAQDPPDVVFRDAKFEIKEILEEDRRRHKEYKEELAHARTINDPQELLTQYTPVDKTITDIYQLCLDRTLTLTKYPTAVREATDLLYYVNLQHVMGLIDAPFPDTSELQALGWRSVSFVKGFHSCVLTTNTDTPDFLIKAAHLIYLRDGYT